MNLAWSTSLLSKVATIGVQVLALPLVYRALGVAGYAAYAAVTASATMLSVLNLGIGGSLVTPLAEAVARQDEREQAVLVQAGLTPLLLACLLGAVVAIPIVAFLPLSALFGRVGATGSWDLRIAAVIAVSVTLATIPLNAVGFLRQAYQEMHITNLNAAVFNILFLIALLVAARRTTSVSVFVAIVVFIPLVTVALNFGMLILQRPFLLRNQGHIPWEERRRLLADGIRYLSASFAPAFLFPWPVYWIARGMPASASSLFAICIQTVVLPLGFVYGFILPLWSSTADARARGDHHWLESQIRRGRILIVAVGGCAFLTYLFFGERLISLWLRKPVTLDWQVRGLMGAYILLGLWEQFHFTMALGCGRLRDATMAVFQRSICYGLAVPLLTMIGGVRALWIGMCCSILFWTAWRLPGLLRNSATVAN
jgi:O-antigen/teichoic acid export membrane protein